jgi:hypothetical protein
MNYSGRINRAATRVRGSSPKRRLVLIAVCSAVAAVAVAGTPLASATHSLVKNMAASSAAPSKPCPGRPGICPGLSV